MGTDRGISGEKNLDTASTALWNMDEYELLMVKQHRLGSNAKHH